MGSITQTSSVATVNIADAGSAQKTVYIFLRKFGDTEWSDARPKTTSGASVTYDLTSAGGGNDLRSKGVPAEPTPILSSMRSVSPLLSPDPSLSGISMGSITQTSVSRYREHRRRGLGAERRCTYSSASSAIPSGVTRVLRRPVARASPTT